MNTTCVLGGKSETLEHQFFSDLFKITLKESMSFISCYDIGFSCNSGGMTSNMTVSNKRSAGEELIISLRMLYVFSFPGRSLLISTRRNRVDFFKTKTKTRLLVINKFIVLCFFR